MVLSFSGAQAVWSILKLLLMLVLVVALAYGTAKLVGRYQGGPVSSRNNISIVESYRLMGDKYIAIAKIGDNLYALGIGKEGISLIDKLDPDTVHLRKEFAERQDGQGINPANDGGLGTGASFKDVLNAFKKKSASTKSDNNNNKE
ncbi:MAG: flagellar biosynthetic protein FliO [Lachnospiraceae bacterium]|nr:flagellar biosynthetic protein FliO [Lachnospiraceae bacterium]